MCLKRGKIKDLLVGLQNHVSVWKQFFSHRPARSFANNLRSLEFGVMDEPDKRQVVSKPQRCQHFVLPICLKRRKGSNEGDEDGGFAHLPEADWSPTGRM